MSGSITTFPITTNYIRDLTVTQLPAPDDVLALDGPTNGTRGLSISYLTQLSDDAELNTALKTGTFYF